jgi:chemotaxis protein CheD
MIYVNSGEVSSGGIETKLNSGAIGSCIVIIGFDSEKKVGAMAHIMLPDSAPLTNQLNATKYAANALDVLLNKLYCLKVEKEDIRICLVGGANVLKRENDTIGSNNINSVEKLLDEKGLKIYARAMGGFERRTVLFDIEKECIFYTVGDSKQQILWQTKNKK